MQQISVNDKICIEEQFYKAILPGCDSIEASEAVTSKVGSILARMAFTSLKINLALFKFNLKLK